MLGIDRGGRLLVCAVAPGHLGEEEL
jgi:hypothetical protein